MASNDLERRLKDFRTIDVRKNIRSFLEGKGRDMGRHPRERYASFDYCFNYFQSFRERSRIEDICSPQNLQQSCLQLGFYLASWGMLRGSSFLLNKSAKFYERLLETVVRLDKRLWRVDVDSYTDEHIDLLLAARDALCDSIGVEYKPSDTLISKIMLGIYGNVPAFDDFFRKGFNVGVFNRKHLQHVAEFYQHHRHIFDSLTIYTLDFHTEKTTKRKYTKAKLIDMVGFTEGLAVTSIASR